MKTTWVTFYSYKGGVGRSMALANVAGRLARLGRRVVMIDFDLEAPGLDSFEEFGKGRRAGVVEYIHRFLEEKKTPPIDEFVHECPANARVRGKLWLMPSGCKDEHYAARLHRINWAAMYNAHIAQPLIANWKTAIENTYSPDYVFIDSRTGLTDVGGVCTLHFPDIDVLFFTLNEQNIEGTAAVLKTISQASASRPIDVITVVSPIPNLTKESSVIGDRLAAAETRLGGKIKASIGYFAPVSLKEQVWTLDNQSVQPAILPAYHALADKITQRTRDGIDFYLGQAKDVITTGDIENARDISKALLEQYGERIDALQTAARLLRMLGEKDRSTEAALKVLKIDPCDREAFNWVVTQYKADKKHDALKTLLHENSERITISEDFGKAVIFSETGHSYMQLKEYRHAAASYVRAKDCGLFGTNAVAFRFNFLEAKRRETGSATENMELWKDLSRDALEALDNILKLAADRDNGTTANNFQALSVAFAIVGDMGRAQDLLVRAELEASLLNPTMRLFSVVDYDLVDRTSFLNEVGKMKLALNRGELWDGMKLPKG